MVYGHVRAVYTAVFGSWTDRVHGPCMIVYSLYTALVMYPVHGRPLYTGRKDGRVQDTRPCTRSCTLYTAVFAAVYTAVHGVYGPCTPRHSTYQASQKLTAETCWRAITQIQ